MRRRQSTHEPRPTTAWRIARAVAAAIVATATLGGCAVSVEGVPHAQSQAASPTPPSTATPSRPGVSSLSDLDRDAAVYAEWVSNGWKPSPLLSVTDPATGVRAWLFGPAERVDAGTPGIRYQSAGAPAHVVNWFGVVPIPAGRALDAEQAAADTARSRGGRIVSAEPVAAHGYRGLDVRIEFIDRRGRPIVDLFRFLELPRHLVGIESVGLASDERVLNQVQEIVAGKLTFTTV
ncbi:hypothetical protein [Pseudonocardia cypriaca]|uniref:Lipoprotein n=1 Tax=Pseudonocardia cypriaca TaxID=882449 RepID=A0A543FNF3_9PSEU|nr:hypothetical protein [Pseudonocardia cypriaca]TQM35214.1 hypothetical protein FB388_6642 [Pseudonocardia cypriaca]